MQVFIDESGTFTIPPTPLPSISCIACVVLPTASSSRILEGFQVLAEDWPKEKSGEIKGRHLNEDQCDAALRYFSRNKVRVQAVACDMGMHTPEDIRIHRVGQIEKLSQISKGAFSNSLIAEVEGLMGMAGSISLPEYCQLQVLTAFLHDIIRRQILWLSFFDPSDLSQFDWVVDAKSESLTRMELLWRSIVKPLLQSKSLREPHILVEGGDYSNMPPELTSIFEAPPLHLAPYVRKRSGPFEVFNLNPLLEKVKFSDSTSTIGLQMADVAASIVRRALTGKLRRAGWQRIPSLIVPPLPPGREVIQLVSLNDRKSPWTKAPEYFKVLSKWRAETRTWADELQHLDRLS